VHVRHYAQHRSRKCGFAASAGPSAGIWFYKSDTMVVINVVAGLTPPIPRDLVILLAKTAANPTSARPTSMNAMACTRRPLS
jgi:hypothetical protein